MEKESICELNNEENLKDPTSICNRHLVDACVYIHDCNTRIGVLINLLLDGYYMLNSNSVSQAVRQVLYNPLIIIQTERFIRVVE